jgi:hypothetical protein
MIPLIIFAQILFAVASIFESIFGKKSGGQN